MDHAHPIGNRPDVLHPYFQKRTNWVDIVPYNMALLCWNLKVVLQTLTLIYGMPPTDPEMNGIMVLLRVAVIMMMCREDVMALFRVDLRTRKRILVSVSIILTVALPFLMMLL